MPRSVAVLFGGSGPERAGSLVSGRAAAEALNRLGFPARAVDIADTDLHADLAACDVALVASHGWFGEDGKLQGLLELAHVPYTGSGVLASAAAMHKPTANMLFAAAGLSVPDFHLVGFGVRSVDESLKWAADLGYPVFAKPASGGGSLGAYVVPDEGALRGLLAERKDRADEPELMLCENISGTELSVGIVQRYGGQVVLPILATSHDHQFYDYEVKHTPHLRRHTCPALLDVEVQRRVREDAVTAFDALGCQGYGRVDFIVDDNGIPWILEVNTVPGLSPQGNLATMAAAADMSYDQLIESILSTAFLKGRGYRP